VPEIANKKKGSTRALFRGDSTVDSSVGFASSTRFSQGHGGTEFDSRRAAKHGTEESRFR